MARKDSEDMIRAIGDVLQSASRPASSPETSSLEVCLSLSGASVVVEVRGFRRNLDPVRPGVPQGLETLCRFVDSVEVVREEAGDLVRLTKLVSPASNQAVAGIPSIAKLSGLARN